MDKKLKKLHNFYKKISGWREGNMVCKKNQGFDQGIHDANVVRKEAIARAGKIRTFKLRRKEER